jgi:uncharacterized protein YqgC (DUF456 family)
VDPTVLAAGAVILVGLVGILVPVLPGLLLVLAGVLLWALGEHSTTGWTILGVAVALAAAGSLVQYLVPGRRLRAAGVGTSTTLAGAALAVVGFFVVPVVGLFLGFVLGVYLAELAHSGGHGRAWQATRQAVRAVLTSVGIELATGVVVAVAWVVGVVLTG